MKGLTISIVTFLFLFAVQAQVQIKPLPKAGYEKRIREYVDNMKVVDTHEHLDLPSDGGTRDFMHLLGQYVRCDFGSGGLPDEVYNKLTSGDFTPKEKWNMLAPYWNGISNTAYIRAALLTADKLFGVKTIDSTTIDDLSSKINTANKNSKVWFYDVLKNKCGIERIVADCDWHGPFDDKMFSYTKSFNDYIFINSKNDLNNLAKNGGTNIHTLDDLVSQLGVAFKKAVDEGRMAVKTNLAYNRIIQYSNVQKEQAEAVFETLKNASDQTHLTFNQVKPLQDYMMHRVLDQANIYHLPVQIHTGLLDGSGGLIENSKPTHLVNLFQEYPDVKFILFHASYPYGGELSTLAKNFRNVYIDMCWAPIISPSYCERYLHEWIETVPANKIMGFGGDFFVVEGTYGHLLFARQIVANVLIAKVRDGYFTEAEAIKVAQLILHDNAIKILNLK
jgi:uncharacterized protein